MLAEDADGLGGAAGLVNGRVASSVSQSDAVGAMATVIGNGSDVYR